MDKTGFSRLKSGFEIDWRNAEAAIQKFLKMWNNSNQKNKFDLYQGSYVILEIEKWITLMEIGSITFSFNLITFSYN